MQQGCGCVITGVQSQLAGCSNLNRLDRAIAAISRGVLDLAHDVHSLEDFAIHDVLTVQPGAWDGGDEKLAASRESRGPGLGLSLVAMAFFGATTASLVG